MCFTLLDLQVQLAGLCWSRSLIIYNPAPVIRELLSASLCSAPYHTWSKRPRVFCIDTPVVPQPPCIDLFSTYHIIYSNDIIVHKHKRLHQTPRSCTARPFWKIVCNVTVMPAFRSLTSPTPYCHTNHLCLSPSTNQSVGCWTLNVIVKSVILSSRPIAAQPTSSLITSPIRPFVIILLKSPKRDVPSPSARHLFGQHQTGCWTSSPCYCTCLYSE